MNIQDGDKFLFEPKGGVGKSHLHVVHGKTNGSFRLKVGIRDMGGGYTLDDARRWLNLPNYTVTYFPLITKSVSEILDECQDI